MALVHHGTMMMTTTNDNQDGQAPDPPTKKVFLVAAFAADRADDVAAGPVGGMAEQVVAVIGIDGDRQRFEWVGADQGESVTNPALVTPIRVALGLPSPYHPPDDRMLTGLVQLTQAQLGDGSVDDDLDHLLRELNRSRGAA